MGAFQQQYEYNHIQANIIIMFGKFIRVIKNPQIKSLVNKNIYRLYNQVPKFDPGKDYYQILEVTKESSDSDIKKSYYRLAKSYHPDSNPGKQSQFKEINEAYSVLSDNNLKKQYNAARSFRGFSKKMGRKAKQGHYNYEQYRNVYNNLSPEEQAEVLEQARKRLRKVIIFGIAMLIILPFLTRRNHRYYVLDHGELVPVEFQGGMAQGMMPPPGMINQGQAPYPGQAPYGDGPYPRQPQPQQGYYPRPSQPPPPSGYQSPYNSYQTPPPQNPYRQSNYSPQ